MAGRVDLGKVTGASMRFRGAWDKDSNYVNDAEYIDCVIHGGSMFVCSVSNKGVEPLESGSTQWAVGAKGETQSVGDITKLETTAKNNVVSAINELNSIQLSKNLGIINFTGTATELDAELERIHKEQPTNTRYQFQLRLLDMTETHSVLGKYVYFVEGWKYTNGGTYGSGRQRFATYGGEVICHKRFTGNNMYLETTLVAKDVEDIVSGKDYQTSADVDKIVEGKGYQTETQVNNIVSGKVGELNNLATTDKTSVVNAINELNSSTTKNSLQVYDFKGTADELDAELVRIHKEQPIHSRYQFEIRLLDMTEVHSVIPKAVYIVEGWKYSNAGDYGSGEQTFKSYNQNNVYMKRFAGTASSWRTITAS